MAGGALWFSSDNFLFGITQQKFVNGLQGQFLSFSAKTGQNVLHGLGIFTHTQANSGANYFFQPLKRAKNFFQYHLQQFFPS